jgi:hypothetical protein
LAPLIETGYTQLFLLSHEAAERTSTQKRRSLTNQSLDIFGLFRDIKEAASAEGVGQGLVQLSQMVEDLWSRIVI